MAKITNFAELKAKKSELQTKIELRKKSGTSDSIIQIKVGMATSGIASGAKTITNYLIEELGKRDVKALVLQVGDMGYCYAEPTIEVIKPGEEPVVFGYVDIAKADQIIEKYIKNGELLDGILPVNYQSVK